MSAKINSKYTDNYKRQNVQIITSKSFELLMKISPSPIGNKHVGVSYTAIVPGRIFHIPFITIPYVTYYMNVM